MNISIIIPVYHEEKTIKKVLTAISKKVKTSYEILTIYDSALDPTCSVIRQLKPYKKNLRLIKNAVGSGIGVMNAIKTGFSKARGNALVVVMADLSDDISQIDTMYQLISEGNSIVCASRYMKGGKKIGGPFVKTFLSQLACLSLYHILRLPTHDATNAFKMFHKKIFSSITIESTEGFEYSLEIVLKAHKMDYTISEIPTIWKDREEGKSNFKLLRWLPQYIHWYLFGFRSSHSNKTLI